MTTPRTPAETIPAPTRREAVTALAAGFALAVTPVSAETITTDTEGLVADGNRHLPGDESMPAYRAAPAAGGPFPVVLVVQEIFGVHEHIRDVCRRLAKLGWLAVAPELYHRHGDVSKIENFQEIISRVVSKVPDARVMGDLDATVAWAGANGGDTERLGITGFCWGGRIVWLYAAHSDKVKAGVAWYGRLVSQTDDLHPRNPVDVAVDLRCPVLGLYGGADQGIPLDTVESMRAAIAKGKSQSEIVIYPDAPHGFHADYRPSYRQDRAEDGWKKLLAWFRDHGAG